MPSNTSSHFSGSNAAFTIANPQLSGGLGDRCLAIGTVCVRSSGVNWPGPMEFWMEHYYDTITINASNSLIIPRMHMPPNDVGKSSSEQRCYTFIFPFDAVMSTISMRMNYEYPAGGWGGMAHVDSTYEVGFRIQLLNLEGFYDHTTGRDTLSGAWPTGAWGVGWLSGGSQADTVADTSEAPALTLLNTTQNLGGPSPLTYPLQNQRIKTDIRTYDATDPITPEPESDHKGIHEWHTLDAFTAANGWSDPGVTADLRPMNEVLAGSRIPINHMVIMPEGGPSTYNSQLRPMSTSPDPVQTRPGTTDVRTWASFTLSDNREYHTGAGGGIITLFKGEGDGIAEVEATIDHTTDALLQAEISVTHTTDARLLLPATVLHEQTTDALLQAEISITYTTDALLAEEVSITHTTEAELFEVLAVTHTTDLLLFESDIPQDHTTNALLWAEQTLTHTTDAEIKFQYDIDHTTDSRVFGALKHSSDASVLCVGTAISHTTDCWAAVAVEQTYDHTTDALLWSEGSLAHTTDAAIWALEELSHTTDLLIYRSHRKSYTTDASMQEINIVLSHTTDAFIGNVVGHHTNALLKEEVQITHTTDSILSEQHDITHTTDTLLAIQRGAAHTTDAILAEEHQITHTTDAILAEEHDLPYTTDAWLTGFKIQTTDASLLETIEIEQTTDALIKREVRIWHGTDSELRDEGRLWHSTDALTSWETDGVGSINFGDLVTLPSIAASATAYKSLFITGIAEEDHETFPPDGHVDSVYEENMNTLDGWRPPDQFGRYPTDPDYPNADPKPCSPCSGGTSGNIPRKTIHQQSSEDCSCDEDSTE